MLQIPDHLLFNKGKTYAHLAELYLPETAYQPAITTVEQQTALNQLDSQLKKEQFYTVTDVRTGEITCCNGINRWLGYTDTHFTRKKYASSIHPAHAVVQGFYAYALFDTLISNQLTTQFLQQPCITTLALKNKTGKYIYCKRQCYPFQLTSDGRMTEYISEFTIVKMFAGEDYTIRIWNESEQLNASNTLLKKIVKKKFEEANTFSVQELRIIKRYANTENITSEMIAKAFKIEKVTVDKFNKRILKKCENVFELRFDNAKKAAGYFKAIELI